VIPLSSRALQLFAGTFGLYHAVLGLINLDSYQQPVFVLVGLFGYLGALVLSVFYPRGIELPSWVASLNFIVALTVPLLVTAGLGDRPVTSYTTWYVAAMGTLLAITAVRGRAVFAWIGIAAMVIETLVWGGATVLFTGGIFGAVFLVLGANAAARALASSEQMVIQFREKSLATEAATVAQSAARAERERRITQTLSGVLPQLERIVSSHGDLTSEEKALAVLTEAELRDQIRGRSLAHPELAKQTRRARSRGVEVQLLDDGGFENLAEDQIVNLLQRVATELRSVQTGKVVIRSVSGESWNLTMAAIRKGAEQPDLFLRL
jgi:hypothetical protein